MKLTRNKIALDLNYSPYKIQINYPDSDVITYVFSSEFYRKNFDARLEENRAAINETLSNKYGFKVEMDKLADLRLYNSIEKRGFLIYKGLVKVECLKEITLHGSRMICKN